jgi:hypothetical protein
MKIHVHFSRIRNLIFSKTTIRQFLFKAIEALNFIKKLCKKLSTNLIYFDSNLKYVYFVTNSKFLLDDLIFLSQIRNSKHDPYT